MDIYTVSPEVCAVACLHNLQQEKCGDFMSIWAGTIQFEIFVLRDH